MKRFLLGTFIGIYCISLNAQTNGWIGGASGNWSSAGNWSQGHTPTSTEMVFINTNCTINVNSFVGTTRAVNGIYVTGNVTAKLACSVNGTRSLQINSTGGSPQGLQIDAGSTLIFDATNSAGTGNWIFDVTGGAGVFATVYGTLQFEGTGAGAGAARFDLYSGAANYGYLTVTTGGKIICKDDTGDPDEGDGSYLTMMSGSVFESQDDGASIPNGVWMAGSLLKLAIAGATSPVFAGNNYADLEVNCNMSNPIAFNKNISFNDVNLVSTGSNVIAVRDGSGTIPYTLTINGNLTISSLSTLQMGANTAFDDSSGNIKVKGNIVNNGAIKALGGNHDNRFELNGTSNQNLSGNGLWFGNNLYFLMNNPAGLTLLSPVNFRCYLVFSNGKIKTTSTNILCMMMVSGDGFAGGWYGGSPSSFVEGPMRRVSDRVSFTFPIGKGNAFAPIAYRNTLNYMLTDTFTAEYFRANPGAVYSNNYDPVGNPEVIHHISRVEYWSIQKNAGGPAQHRIEPNVQLTSFCKNLDSTFVARYDAGTNLWKNCNNYGRNLETPGPPYVTGWIYGAYVPLGVGIFTLGTNMASNPLADEAQGALPIRLLTFDAVKINSTKSLLNWQAADFCTPSEKFEVQRAGSDKRFVTIATIQGNENDRFYTYPDNDMKTGVNYYRLRMTDKDGAINYSRVVAIMNNVNGLLLTSLMPTVVTDKTTLTVASSGSQKLDIIVVDIQGRVMMRRNFTVAAGNTNIELSMARLGAGVYVLTGITPEGKSTSIRFIKQ